MYSNRGARENNNVLNPSGAPTTQQDYRPERGGYQNYGQNGQSAVSSLIYGETNEQQIGQFKPSIQISNGQKHHHQSNLVMSHEGSQGADYNQLNKAQVGALSDIQQRIMEQNKQIDIMNSQKTEKNTHNFEKQIKQVPLKNDYIDQSSIGQKQAHSTPQGLPGSANAKRRNLSEKRRDGSQNLRSVGEQALRNSSINRPAVENIPPPKQQKGPAADENIFALASKPVADPMRNSYQLEPIENYKGKSVAELEAILDNHNAHQKTKNEVPQVQEQEQIQPNLNIEKRQSRYGSQKRTVSRGKVEDKKEEKKKLELTRVGPSGGQGGQGPRPPLAPKQSNEQQDQRKGYGKVPKYLQKFNLEKEEKQRQKEIDMEQAKCPPGTRKMEDQERKDMLKELDSTKYKLEDEIQKFPLTMKTMAIQKRKDELVDQLEKCEKNIKLFSKDVVFIGI